MKTGEKITVVILENGFRIVYRTTTKQGEMCVAFQEAGDWNGLQRKLKRILEIEEVKNEMV